MDGLCSTMVIWSRSIMDILLHLSTFLLDEHSETLRAGYRNNNGKLFHPVKAVCGALASPPYHDNRYLTCVVCAKCKRLIYLHVLSVIWESYVYNMCLIWTFDHMILMWKGSSKSRSYEAKFICIWYEMFYIWDPYDCLEHVHMKIMLKKDKCNFQYYMDHGYLNVKWRFLFLEQYLLNWQLDHIAQ